MAWGLDSTAAFNTYRDGAGLSSACVSDEAVAACAPTRRQSGTTCSVRWRHCCVRLISWWLFVNTGRWQLMTGISPGVDVRQSDDITLHAANLARRVCLPARQPRWCRPNWQISRLWSWPMNLGVALARNDNNWSREYSIAIRTVINRIWTAKKM